MRRRTNGMRWRVALFVAASAVMAIGCRGDDADTASAATERDPDADPQPGGVVAGAETGTDPAYGTGEDVGAGPAGGTERGDDTRSGANVVRFVYFVERGETVREDVRLAIEAQANELQRYWYRQFGGTFRLDDPVVTVVEGDQDAAWYDTTPDGIHTDPRWYRLGNIATEVRSKLGTANTRFVNYPATTISEPRVGVNFDGAWMDGDDALCILGETPSYPYPDGNDANCLGHVVHELGHVFGLEHTGPDEDCMQFGFYDAETMCRFSSANRAAVRENPANVGWLDVELDLPIDPDPVDDGDGSVADPGSVEVTLVNTGCRAVEVFWLDGDDQLQPYGTIAPGANKAQPTFVDHRWVFRVGTEEVDRWVVPETGTHRIESGGCSS